MGFAIIRLYLVNPVTDNNFEKCIQLNVKQQQRMISNVVIQLFVLNIYNIKEK